MIFVAVAALAALAGLACLLIAVVDVVRGKTGVGGLQIIRYQSPGYFWAAILFYLVGGMLLLIATVIEISKQIGCDPVAGRPCTVTITVPPK